MESNRYYQVSLIALVLEGWLEKKFDVKSCKAIWKYCVYLGIHGLVYMVVNKKICDEVLKLFGLKGKIGIISSTPVLTVSKGQRSEHLVSLED